MVNHSACFCATQEVLYGFGISVKHSLIEKFSSLYSNTSWNKALTPLEISFEVPMHLHHTHPRWSLSVYEKRKPSCSTVAAMTNLATKNSILKLLCILETFETLKLCRSGHHQQEEYGAKQYLQTYYCFFTHFSNHLLPIKNIMEYLVAKVILGNVNHNRI